MKRDELQKPDYLGFFRYDRDRWEAQMERGGLSYWLPIILLAIAAIALFCVVCAS